MLRLRLPQLHAKQRRRIHLVVSAVWLGPGAYLSVVLAHSVPWVVFMSWFACWYTSMAAWAAETPVEKEER